MINIDFGLVERQKIEVMVDQEIKSFDCFVQTLGNPPLSRFERAIIKTYFAWKVQERDAAKIDGAV